MIFLILIVSPLYVTGQDRFDMNLVILINEHVPIGSISKLRLMVDGEEFEADYVPGDFQVPGVRLEDLISSSSSISLAFDYNDFEGNKHELYNYQIDLEKGWIDKSFVVLRIYDLSKKKYRRQFCPLQGKNYTFELDLPGQSIARVRKRNANDSCH